MQVSTKKIILPFIYAFISYHANAKETLTVVTEHWPPYNYADENGEVKGIATEQVKAILEQAGIDYEMSILSWSRAYSLAKDSDNVLIYTIYQSEERETEFQWFCPLIQTNEVNIYQLTDSAAVTFNHLDELKPYTLGVVNDDITVDYLKSRGFDTSSQLNVSSDEDANVRLLLNGRIDFIVQEESALKLRLARVGSDFTDVKKVFTLLPSNNAKSCMATGLTTPKRTVDKIRTAIRELRLNQANLPYK